MIVESTHLHVYYFLASVAVDVRVMRQSHYLMDKSRVALLRGRHQIKTLSQNGNGALSS